MEVLSDTDLGKFVGHTHIALGYKLGKLSRDA